MNNCNLTQLEEECSNVAPIAAQFAKELNEQLHQLLSEQRIYLGSVEWRIKTWHSLAEKVERKSLSISSILDLDDFIGLRLILLFRRDVASACQIIEEAFKVVSSEDAARRLGEEQFGYGSIHYVVELPDSWLNVPTFKSFRGFKAEIQVRTSAQHMWASASHALQYKQESGVPPPVRRAIHRVSALLETVDLEFERVLSQKEEYQNTLSESTGSEQLNVDSLAKLLDELLPPPNKQNDDPEDYSALLRELNDFAINTPDKLRNLITTHRDRVLEEDRRRVSEGFRHYYSDSSNARIDQGVYFTHVGLTRLALSAEFGQEWMDYNEPFTDPVEEQERPTDGYGLAHEQTNQGTD